ncbi:uncharacterized protein B0I36DRAFT_431197 [Microdochium trichocladiopsis]|uniref:Uncharacterized protein n=1 Tax=Microdochium trichocladiopsis TaxID=1682393 RepID=A0A9P9BN77_9PEZI|nr:uncharacterized protein B0I36DRAFT_431197 [Microdochium trichocladiopsis]KAH7030976.1 hypothetical protein B0I36DRAFT_431197 [Microdochium trichocladiopsis]
MFHPADGGTLSSPLRKMEDSSWQAVCLQVNNRETRTTTLLTTRALRIDTKKLPRGSGSPRGRSDGWQSLVRRRHPSRFGARARVMWSLRRKDDRKNRQKVWAWYPGVHWACAWSSQPAGLQNRAGHAAANKSGCRPCPLRACWSQSEAAMLQAWTDVSDVSDERLSPGPAKRSQPQSPPGDQAQLHSPRPPHEAAASSPVLADETSVLIVRTIPAYLGIVFKSRLYLVLYHKSSSRPVSWPTCCTGEHVDVRVVAIGCWSHLERALTRLAASTLLIGSAISSPLRLQIIVVC